MKRYFWKEVAISTLTALVVGIPLAFVVSPQEHIVKWTIGTGLINIVFRTTLELSYFVYCRYVERLSGAIDVRPPGLARSLLWLFAKPKQRDPMVDDLDEVFFSNVARYGVFKARWIYRWDAFRSIFASIVGLAAGAAVIRKLFHG